MGSRTVRRIKVFWAWQDDKEEAWLAQMSRQGLHLTGPLLPFVYTLSEGEPRDLAYRLDYVYRMSREQRGEYMQLFQDSGWEHLGEMSGWQYLRKPVEAGEEPEIFTDPESKIAKYKRLLGYLFIMLPVFVVLLSRVGTRPSGTFFEVLNAVLFLFFLLFLYAFVRIALRIRQLRRL